MPAEGNDVGNGEASRVDPVGEHHRDLPGHVVAPHPLEVSTQQPHAPCQWRLQPADGTQQGGFTGPIGSYQADEVPLLKAGFEPLQDHLPTSPGAVPDGKPGQLQDVHSATLRPCSRIQITTGAPKAALMAFRGSTDSPGSTEMMSAVNASSAPIRAVAGIKTR